jgi:hypothetical protein
MPDPTTAQNLYDALKTFMSAAPGTHGDLYAMAKDFQTFGAALVAFAAALVAYRGAMAKVKLEEREAEKKRSSERLALSLRVLMAVNSLKVTCAKLRGVINDSTQPQKNQLLVQIPKEFDEADQRLDLFSDKIANVLWSLRQHLMLIIETIERSNNWQDVPLNAAPPILKAEPRGKYVDYVGTVEKHCAFIASTLPGDIAAMRKKIGKA